MAERLGVTTRTIRNDVERLRNLGYPVDATSGVAGGYRLGAGAALPPLLLDDEEAVAVAVGLRTASSLTGIAETSVRALAKLEQVLPSRLRGRVRALAVATVEVPGRSPTVAADILTTLAAVCRDHERLRFDYEARRVPPPRRTPPPGPCERPLVPGGLRPGPGDWRTFRVDRLTPKIPTGPRFTPREPPTGDLASYVAAKLGTATWRYRAEVRVHASAAVLAARHPPGVEILEPGEESCLVAVGSDNPEMLATYIGLMGADFETSGPPELLAHFDVLARRYAAAARVVPPAGDVVGRPE